MSTFEKPKENTNLWPWLGAFLAIVLLIRIAIYSDGNRMAAANSPEPSSDQLIHLTEDKIDPLAAMIEVGETASWINDTGGPIQLTSAYNFFDPVTINPGQAYQWTNESPIQFQYQTSRHTEAGIFVVVENRANLYDGRSAEQEYQETCSSCHGSERGGGVGPELTSDQLTEDNLTYFNTIKNGRPGTAMPAWGDELSDAEIWLFIGFLRTDTSTDGSDR